MEKKLWEIEKWGKREWIEQAKAEYSFAKMIGVQYDLDEKKLDGIVAGYRVRRVRNGLKLLQTDGDDDIFVAIKMLDQRTARIVGWLRGSEGKRPEFREEQWWVVPAQMLHDIQELPSTEQLKHPPLHLRH